MPLTFGAVGDVIAVAQLVKEILDALDSTRGAAPEYQEVRRELYGLAGVLLQVEHTVREHRGASGFTDICNHALQCVANCSISVESLLGKIKKYKRTLAQGSRSNMPKTIAMKLRWGLVDHEEVMKLQKDIMVHTLNLNMMMSTLTCKVLEDNSRQLSNSIAQSSTTTLGLLTSHGAALDDIRGHLHRSNFVMARHEALIASIQIRVEENNGLIRRQDTSLMDIKALLRNHNSFAWLMLAFAGRIIARLLGVTVPCLLTSLEILLSPFHPPEYEIKSTDYAQDLIIIVTHILAPIGMQVAIYRRNSWFLISLSGIPQHLTTQLCPHESISQCLEHGKDTAKRMGSTIKCRMSLTIKCMMSLTVKRGMSLI